MGLFSFGSKKNKIIKMLSEGELEKILHSAAKDPKYVDAVVELLNEENPGIRGDALLIIGELTIRHRDLMMPYIESGLPRNCAFSHKRSRSLCQGKRHAEL